MINPFCQFCYDKHMKRIKLVAARMPGGFSRVKVDVGSMTFRCRTPFYSSDHNGDPVAKLWDCKENRDQIYRLEDFRLRESQGEFE